MNTYPENDYRAFLKHSAKGSERKGHKYISRKMGEAGKWIYTYATKAGSAAKRQIDLASSRRDIQKQMAGRYTEAKLNELNEQGRVSDRARYEDEPNFGKENEYTKSRRTSTKVKNAVDTVKSNAIKNVARKYPKLDQSLQKSKYSADRAAKTISRAVQKIKNKSALKKSRKDLNRISRDVSDVNGFPKLYNRMMAADRITSQNKWMSPGQNKRSGVTSRRKSNTSSSSNKKKLQSALNIVLNPIENKKIKNKKIKNKNLKNNTIQVKPIETKPIEVKRN